MEQKLKLRHPVRGQVCFYQFLDQGSSIQNGYRPCVVVGNNKQNLSSPCTIVVPMTTKTKSNLPTHVVISKHDYEVYGTVMCEQIFTVPIDQLQPQKIYLDENTMRKIDYALEVELHLHMSQTTYIKQLEKKLKLYEGLVEDFRALQHEFDLTKAKEEEYKKLLKVCLMPKR